MLNDNVNIRQRTAALLARRRLARPNPGIPPRQYLPDYGDGTQAEPLPNYQGGEPTQDLMYKRAALQDAQNQETQYGIKMADQLNVDAAKGAAEQTFGNTGPTTNPAPTSPTGDGLLPNPNGNSGIQPNPNSLQSKLANRVRLKRMIGI
jgi:hypothetical protein